MSADLVAWLPFNSAPMSSAWRVVRRSGDAVRIVSADGRGVYVDAAPDELIRLGRPYALELAAMLRPLRDWPRADLREYLEMPAGTPCGECGRPRMGAS